MSTSKAALGIFVLLSGLAGAGRGELPGTQDIAKVESSSDRIVWVLVKAGQGSTLTVSGPTSYIEREFPPKRNPSLSVRERKEAALADGRYRWELRLSPELDPKIRERLAKARRAREEGRTVNSREIEALLPSPMVQSGAFSIANGKIVQLGGEEPKEVRSREEGDVQIGGNLEVEGKKAFTMADESSNTTIVYVALEGPEAGTYYRGTARTVRGEAVIDLPDHFAKVTETAGLTAQITPVGSWSRLYLVESTPERLVVRDAEGGDGVEFDFLVQGVRKGYLGHRPERAFDHDHPANR